LADDEDDSDDSEPFVSRPVGIITLEDVLEELMQVGGGCVWGGGGGCGAGGAASAAQQLQQRMSVREQPLDWLQQRRKQTRRLLGCALTLPCPRCGALLRRRRLWMRRTCTWTMSARSAWTSRR
jgi:hypothetical protein